jgi:xylulokinase
MLLLGIDIGTSSIKVSVVDAATRQCVAAAQYPETETTIIAVQPGWAEQSPEHWWQHVQKAILKCHATKLYNSKDIAAIGIAYQMHGLVAIDAQQRALRNSIIWCDSRAVAIGNKAIDDIGTENCLQNLLNSPGNFTASKLAWVKQNEPAVYGAIDKVLLPGDFIAMKFTGEISTTASALSEGVFWNFRKHQLSEEVLNYFGFSKNLFPAIKPVFFAHGILKEYIATELSLKKGIPVSYKAGDQPNNALSLNVFNPGEVAATAGTSGVIYAVSDTLNYDKASRINGFAHVNHQKENSRIGNLLCINGTGIFNRWARTICGATETYHHLNEKAAAIPIGCVGLKAIPFGNGAERMLNNAMPGASLVNLNFNVHATAHILRAVQEGIAFAFRYGIDIMRENGIQAQLVRAGKANLFLSTVFTQSFSSATNTMIELYENDGSVGAAIGAGLGAGIFSSEKEAFEGQLCVQEITPQQTNLYEELYQEWKQELKKRLLETTQY